MKKKLLLLLFTCLLITNVDARDSGKINGYIRDQTGQPLAGATIILKELKLRSESNIQGRFEFGNLPQGKFSLMITPIGFRTQTRTVTVKSGEIVSLDIVCSSDLIQLEPVTVTAEKRENVLQKVPMAVSALDGNQIKERNIREMGDLVLAVPNLMSMNIGSPTLNVMSIRGVLTFSTDPVVGVYVDGVPMFDGYSASQQLQNIERVEVLRGPQSTLYGRNGLGGVINIITKKPGNTANGFAETGIGNYGSQRLNAGISFPLIKNKLFAGISGVYDTHRGYFTNEFTNSDFDQPKTYNGNFYLKYLPADRLTFTFNAKGEYNKVRGTFPYAANAVAAAEKPYTINQNGTNIEKRKLFSSSLSGIYRLDGAELSSVTGYTYLSDTYSNYDVDYSPFNAILFEVPDAPQHTLTQEFKIVTNKSGKLKFTGGLFGFIDQKKSQNTYIYGPDAVSFDPKAPYTSNIYADKKIYGIAGYANLSYAFAEKWEVTAGLRYDYEKRNMLYSTDFLKAPDPLLVVVPEKKLDGHNGAFSPKLSLSYTPVEDLLFYTTYSRGYRSGGFNPYTANPDRLNYKPEYTNNYETGIKSEWLDKRLRANASFFYTRWKDQQQTLSLPENITDNVGELTSKGGELELTGLILKDLIVNYNLGVVQTNYEKLILPDGSGQNKDYAGNKQIFTPDFTSSLSVTYRHSFGDQTSLYVSPEWKYFGKQYMTYYNDLEQKPFNLLNASAGINYKNMEFSLWVKNIGETKYLSFAYATQMATSTPVLMGNPRTYGTSVKFKF